MKIMKKKKNNEDNIDMCTDDEEVYRDKNNDNVKEVKPANVPVVEKPVVKAKPKPAPTNSIIIKEEKKTGGGLLGKKRKIIKKKKI